jgi:subtilisin family serine protease
LANGDRIHVAILDSGVAPTKGLPDDRIAQYRPTGDREDRHDRTRGFHGTQVASVLASDDPATLGVAPQVRCSCFDVYNSEQVPVESNVVAALTSAVAMEVDLICCTFTLERLSDELHRAIEAVRAAAIPLVVSAGNTARRSGFPQSASGLICVRASGLLRTILDGPAGSPARGRRSEARGAPTIAAPGLDLPASTPSGVVSFSGTSAAAPVAAGVVALALAHARQRGVEPWFRTALAELLLTTADRTTNPPLIAPRAFLRTIDERAHAPQIP